MGLTNEFRCGEGVRRYLQHACNVDQEAIELPRHVTNSLRVRSSHSLERYHETLCG